jgi:3-deoxy-D-manno-octulosonic-acid transferase
VKLLYNIFIGFYRLLVSFVALWNKKAQEWTLGQKTLFVQLKQRINPADPIIWMHCASAGEFEQGKPVLEALKAQNPHYKVLVTFFSPSGYQSGRKYKGADIISYLPLDTERNVAKFLEVVNPTLVIFIKYEYWYHHLKAVADRNIPLLLVSSIFRKNQVFFKGYGGFYRNILKFYRWIFVQDEQSVQLLKNIGIDHCSIGGDTRFDRVSAIVRNFTKLDIIDSFVGNDRALVAGSTWPDDEALIAGFYKSYSGKLKLIIAPHEINKGQIDHLFHLFPNAIAYSQIETKKPDNYQVLIIDNVGMLSRLYRYALITYIGGGFNKSGIHNTLEAAVWGKPVIFGPNYQKFKEARDLVSVGAAFSVTNATELKEQATTLLENDILLQQSSRAAKQYVEDNKGATSRIIDYIQENRLLTR